MISDESDISDSQWVECLLALNSIVNLFLFFLFKAEYKPQLQDFPV